eukprot:Skav208977  [mRNA]  locus=scaffold1039:71442:71993:+ [translate_table: standard]
MRKRVSFVAEVLIEEVLKEMKGIGKDVKLQDVFDNSMFRHIKTTTMNQLPDQADRPDRSSQVSLSHINHMNVISEESEK